MKSNNNTEKRSTLYAYAIIGQPIFEEQKYLWQKCGKYRKLIDAEKALKDMNNNDKVINFIYKIVPYFDGYWWTDEEARKQSYVRVNTLLWKFLNSKGLSDEVRKFLDNENEKHA
jgi:hypothetical protein